VAILLRTRPNNVVSYVQMMYVISSTHLVIHYIVSCPDVAWNLFRLQVELTS